MTAHPARSLQPQPRQTASWCPLLLLGVTAITFYPVCNHPFSWWDDQETIHQNPMFNPPDGQQIRRTWTAPQKGLYVPLTYTLWGALARVAELPEPDAHGIHLDARVYHTASLILHMASAMLVFSILHLLCQKAWPAFAGALLFALHPVQVETVAWTSGMKDLLCGLLALCAIYQYILYAQCTSGRRRVYLFGSAALLVLAMLAKPSAMVVPLVTLAIDRLILNRSWTQALRASSVLLVAVVPLAVIARTVQELPQLTVPWWQRPLIAADCLVFYLCKLILPMQMGPDYGRRSQVVLEMWNGWWVYIALFIAVMLGLFAWRGRKRRPWLLTACIIFVAGVLPVLGFAPFMFQHMSSVADHYLYLSMLAPALVVTWLTTRIGESFALFPRRWCDAATTALLALCSLRSIDQLSIWRDEESLWSHDMAIAPHSFVAPTNLAAHLGRQSRILADALAQAQSPSQAEQARKLARARTALLERAVTLLEQAIAIRPSYSTAHHNAYVNCLRLNQPERALAHLEALIRINRHAPPEIQPTLLPHHNAAAELCLKLGRFDQAVEHFQHIATALPKDQTAQDRLRVARMKQAEARIDPTR